MLDVVLNSFKMLGGWNIMLSNRHVSWVTFVVKSLRNCTYNKASKTVNNYNSLAIMHALKYH